MKLLFAKTAEGVKFYPITIADGVIYKPATGDAVKLNEFLDSIDYSGKADKVSGATNGNFAGLDSNGNLTDSGYKASDFQAAGDYKTVQTAVADPTASGNAAAFIDSITQDTNGVITVTKKNVQNASAEQAGLMSSTDYSKLSALPTNSELETSLGGKADKVASATNGNFAGLDSNGNLTDSGSKASDFATAAQGGKADTAVQSVALEGGTNNGTVKLTVDGTATDNIAVTGLGSAAYENTTAFDAAGAAATAKSEVIGEATDASSASTIYGAKKKAEEEAAAVLGTSDDTASANTVYGAKAYADSLVVGGVIYKGTVNGTTSVLPTEGYKQGWEYAVTVAGTYAGKACDAGDFLIANKDYASGATAANDWDIKQGTVAVTNAGADLVIGTATQIATVEGVNITVKQVEDMTKIEAEACGDTSEYPDYSSLFTTPSAGE